MKDNIINIAIGTHKAARSTSLLRQVEWEKRKITAFSTLASILIAVTLANNTLLAPQKQRLVAQIETMARSSRAIASIDNSAAGSLDNLSSDELVKRYDNDKEHHFQVMGQKPTVLEHLRYGLLEGKYAVRTKDGVLKEIEFVESSSQGEAPKYFENRMAFLKEIKGLLPSTVASMAQIESQDRRELFSLRDSAQREVARVIFVSDEFGRLMSLTVAADELN